MTESNLHPKDTPALDPKLHFHLMGIGGIGMSAFARLLHAKGHQVSGCDIAAGEQTDALPNEGLPVDIGHDARHITEAPHGPVDVLIASPAVPQDHPEVVAARDAGVEVRPRMALLDTLLRAGPSIGVIGTHGKTTTTSMIAVALHGAGMDPSAFVGGTVPEFGNSNARLGQGPFVAEVDESDSLFADLVCETAVFTNAEDDHIGGKGGGKQATYWETVEEQHAAFAKFVSQARRVLYCADWAMEPSGASGKVRLETLCSGARELWTYGEQADADYRAVDVRTDPEGTSFSVQFRGEVLGQARVNLPGHHNLLNALAALAVVHLYGGHFAPASEALRRFLGPKRRWERAGQYRGALVINDYAHNATKAEAAVDAARQTGRRVKVVFQPHRYLRTAQSWPRLADALMKADEVLLLDIYGATEPPIEGIHSRLIEQRMREQGHRKVTYFPQREAALQDLRSSAGPNDVIVMMGAGDVGQLANQLVEERV